MKHRIYCKVWLATALCMMMTAGHARGKWTLSGKEYSADTLSHQTLTEGITETHLHLTGPSSIHLFYLTVDMDTPGLALRPFTGKDRPTGLEAISQTIGRNIEAGLPYVAAVNSDFFSFQTHQCLGALVMDGDILNTELGDDYAYVAVDKKGTPYLTGAGRSQTMLTAGGDTMRIEHINRTEAEQGTTLYTHAYGTMTGRNQPELILKTKKKPLRLNSKMKCKVLGFSSNGNTPLYPGRMAISVPREKEKELMTFASKKKAKVEVEMKLDNAPDNEIKQLVGGKPMLVRDGKTIAKNDALDHLPQLHPRTAIGHSADKRKVVLMVVDGRSSESAGMTSYQLADAMREAGCTEAMNLDGGGSSELFTTSGGVRNVVSDGHERAVANGIGVMQKKAKR